MKKMWKKTKIHLHWKIALCSDKYQFNLSTSMSWRNLPGSKKARKQESERDDVLATAGAHPRGLGVGKIRFSFREASAELPRGFRGFRGQNGCKIISQSCSGYIAQHDCL